MKKAFLLIFLSINYLSYCQSGYHYIEKAEKKIQSGKLNRALRLLELADSSDYGFCGNAWASAYDAIALKRARIYKLQGKPTEAAKAIWNVGGPLVFEQHDSLKVAYLVEAYGIKEVRKGIDLAIDSLASDTVFSNTYYPYNLTVYFSFSDQAFGLSYRDIRDAYRALQFEAENFDDNMDYFLEAIRKQPFYQLVSGENQSKN
jgi:tetratricopeptide (TPR) repeat protein